VKLDRKTFAGELMEAVWTNYVHRKFMNLALRCRGEDLVSRYSTEKARTVIGLKPDVDWYALLHSLV
jgi:hypothetical protein